MANALDWHPAVIRACRDLTPDIREFDLVPLDRPTRGFTPGAHLQITVMVGGQPQTRSYSLVGEPGDSYRIAVKRRADSTGGSIYLWSLQPGARVTISTPNNAFALDLGARDVLLVAGGIGITPMVGMARQLARRSTRFRLLYAARSEAHFAYIEELSALGSGVVETFVRGAGRPLDLVAAFETLPPDALCVVCGPLPMLDEARRLWTTMQRPAHLLRWETFGSSGHFAAEPFRVLIPRHQLEIMVPANRSLIDALADAGIDVLSNCRRGECGLCTLPVLAVDGAIDHRDVFLSPEQHHESHRLCTCVSRARGTLTLDTDYRPDAI